mmetsp:Transcript_1158/g.2951  ORF Transcript_1158/g.2951 Transcript_1158/m.2951 type:complete len:271 (-) Transcript_1158:930-1742(-)
MCSCQSSALETSGFESFQARAASARQVQRPGSLWRIDVCASPSEGSAPMTAQTRLHVVGRRRGRGYRPLDAAPPASAKGSWTLTAEGWHAISSSSAQRLQSQAQTRTATQLPQHPDEMAAWPKPPQADLQLPSTRPRRPTALDALLPLHRWRTARSQTSTSWREPWMMLRLLSPPLVLACRWPTLTSEMSSAKPTHGVCLRQTVWGEAEHSWTPASSGARQPDTIPQGCCQSCSAPLQLLVSSLLLVLVQPSVQPSPLGTKVHTLRGSRQ